MKRTIIALLLALPLASFANPPATPVPPVKQRQGQTQGQSQGQSQGQVSNTSSMSGSSAGAQSVSGGNFVGLNASPQLEFKTAQAPDVISYPTAPCRVAIGGSAGWFGGAVGIVASTEDEGCTMRENARQLFNFGLTAAAIQLMCLDANAKLALEATGTKCMIRKPQEQQQPEPVKP